MAAYCPTREPLEKRFLLRLNPNGSTEKLPALHEVWCEKIGFLRFTSPPDASETGGSDHLQKWVELLKMIRDDLRKLIHLPHHQFWSHAVYDKTLRHSLDSYLQRALRPYEDPWSMPTSAQETLSSVHELVFLTMFRLSTNDESSEHFLSPTGFGDLLYTHLIFTIPNILDLCCIYGNSKEVLLSVMVKNIFDKQPKYKEELKICIDDVNNLLDSVTKKVIPEYLSSSLKLDAAEDIDPDKFSDLIVCVADAMHTISSFLLIYPPGAAILWSSGLAIKLIIFYESTITQLQSRWKKSHHSSMRRPVYVKEQLRRCEKLLVSVVRTLLINCVDKREVSSVAGVVIDQVMNCLKVMASKKNFFKEFEKHFSLAGFLGELKQLFPSLNTTRIQYTIFSTVQGEQAAAANLACSSVTGKVSSSSPEILRASARHEDEAVDQIQKILPHLGKGFVKLCLQEYGGDSEKVIDHILEGSLPTHLQLMLFSAEEQVFHHGGKNQLSRVHTCICKRYDDTYYSHNVGADVRNSPDEVSSVKWPNEKGLYSAHQGRRRRSSEEEDKRVQYIFSAVQGEQAAPDNLACTSVTGTVSSRSPEILRASARHEDEVVDQILEILPHHLGRGFAKLCFQEYGGDIEKVIDHILEGSLPVGI